MVRGASAAVASPQSWHRFRYPVRQRAAHHDHRPRDIHRARRPPEACLGRHPEDRSASHGPLERRLEQRGAVAGTLDSLTAMNTEITVMEKILRALMEANREEESPSLMVPDKQSEPLLS